MTSKLLSSTAEKTFAIAFDKDQEAMGELLSFAVNYSVTAAHFTGIGGFSRVVLGYYEKGKPIFHAHAVVAKRDGTTAGGHLLEAHVRPTLELILTESPVHLERRYDEASGLPLIKM
jgi:predicted DNA-binding protein with PD1-like motif